MADMTYRGPGGDMILKEPLPVRLVKSPFFHAVWIIVFLSWLGNYLYRYDQTSFLGTPLSVDHYSIRYKCRICHQTWGEVLNDGCLSANCHGERLTGAIHDSILSSCTKCHPEHLDGRSMPRSMGDGECEKCHAGLEKDPESKFNPRHKASRKFSGVSRDIFRHKTHWYPLYECAVCHCSGPGTINVPLDQLFTMDACTKCHFRENCQLCHHYHSRRDSRPIHKPCITQENLNKLRGQIRKCPDIFIGNLPVCEPPEPPIEPPKFSADENEK